MSSAGCGLEHEFALAGAEFHLDGAQVQAEGQHVAPQNLQDRIHAIQALFGEIIIAVMQQGNIRRAAGLAGLLQCHLGVQQAGEGEFHLQAGDKIIAQRGQPGQGGAHQMARRDVHLGAIGMIEVAQHPAGPRGPGQHAKRRGVGHHHHIRAAFETRKPDSGICLENRHNRAMRCIFQQQCRGDGAAAAQRGRQGVGDQRLAAQYAMQIGK